MDVKEEDKSSFRIKMQRLTPIFQRDGLIYAESTSNSKSKLLYLPALKRIQIDAGCK